MDEQTLPRVLKMKVYLAKAGMPIYFGYEDEDKVYCHPEKEWVQKPTYLDYFKERELRPDDLHYLMLNGLMPHEDYIELNNQGLIDETLGQFYNKMKELEAKVQDFQETEKANGTIQLPAMESQLGTPFSSDKQPEGQDHLVSILEDLVNKLHGVNTAIPNSALQKIIETTQGLSDDERRVLNTITGKFKLEPIK
jgi:hypothetical protein